MFTSTVKKHHLNRFNSLAAFTEYSRGLEDHRTPAMKRDDGKGDYYGTAKSMDELHVLADKGMAREGIKALALAQDRVQSMNRELADQSFATVWDVSGADVDVARFLAGEQENMLDYVFTPDTAIQPVITLVTNVAVHCGITDEAFAIQGAALVAVAEAIDSVGLQSEIWVDCTITEGFRDTKGHTGRFSIRLKSGDGPFDSGAFMFALTHPAFFRGMVLNAMHAWPPAWRESMYVGSMYGYPTGTFIHPEDYPDGAIYIPAMSSNREAGTFVDGVLRDLNLLSD